MYSKLDHGAFKKSDIYILVIFLCTVFRSIGQERYVHIGLEEGLDNLVINDIAKDHKGYIWLATNGGLKRYDGEHLTTIESTQYSFLKNGLVKDILLDGDVIWISLRSRGLFRYDIESGSVSNINLSHEGTSFKNINHISSLGNRLYLSLDRDGVLMLDKRNIEHPAIKSSGVGSLAYTLPIDSAKVIVSPHGDGFRLLANNNLKEDQRLDRIIEGDTIREYTCSNSIQIEGEIWWACWDNALHTLSTETFESESFLLPDEVNFSLNSEEIIDLVQFENNIVLATKTGRLYEFDLTEHKFSILESLYFEGINILDLYKDDDMLWIGTDAGVYIRNMAPSIFSMSEIQTNSGRSLVANVLTSYKEEIVFGGPKGTFRFGNSSCTLIHPQLISYSTHSLLPDGDDLYIGTNKSVFKFENIRKPLENVFDVEIARQYPNYYEPKEVNFSRFSSLTIQQTPYGKRLWAMAYGHFPAFKILGEDWAAYAELYGDVKENLINNIVCDDHNRIHILGKRRGYHEGVRIGSLLCEDDLDFQSFPLKWQYEIDFPLLYCDSTYNISTTPEMPCNDVHDIAFIDNDKYLATSSGLVKLSELGELKKYDLPYNDIGICKYWNGKLWLVASGQLMMLDPLTDDIRLYGKEAGIPSDFNIASLHVHLDSLYIGGKGWIGAAHYTDLMHGDHKDAPLELINVQSLKSDKTINYKDKSIVINESERGLKLSFATLLMPKASNVTYEYMLEGINEHWMDNGKNNDLIIPNLTSGDYNLSIRALQNTGDFFGDKMNIAIEVKPIWFRSWWFRMIMMISGFGLLYALYRYRVNQLLEVTKMRNEISHDLHDDIGSILSSISIYADSAESALENKDPKFAKKIIDKIGHQSRLTIDKMSDIVWSINSGRDTLFDLLDRMEIYGNEVCSAKGVSFNFTRSKLPNEKMDMKKRKNIFLIFKEVLNNALKHSNCSTIDISVTKLSDKIEVVLSDDGIGFNKKVIRHNGFGLSTMAIRAKEMNASLQIDSRTNKGTSIALTF